MPPRAISTATLSFGLVSIPVKVYAASSSSEQISFNLLHRKCGSRLKQQYICPADNNEVVERDEMVKGFEFQKGRYVTFTEEELKAIEETATQAIEITEFLPSARVDPVYFEKAYYLGPDKGGDRPYKLLCAAMIETKRVALAKYATRGKQYLVMVRAKEGGLVMQQLHYADEVKPFAEVPVGEAKIGDNELKLAVQLVTQITRDEFHPEAYRDEGKQRALALIQKKVDGQEVTVGTPEAPKAQVIDLMEALRASLGQKAKPGRAADAPTDEMVKPAAAATAKMATRPAVATAATATVAANADEPGGKSSARKPARRVGRAPEAQQERPRGKVRAR